MPNKNNKATQARPDIVQWFDKETDRYVKFERATGTVLAEKVTAGPYKNIHTAKRRPHIRVPKPVDASTLKENKLEKVPKKKVAKKVVPKKPRKINYLNNKDLMKQVMLSKESDPPQMTDRLAHMLQTLAARYGRKGNFANYTYNEDMQAYAMMMLVRTWNSFNPLKSQNPFAFFTQCIKNSFIQFLNQERRQRDIRDVILVDQGLDPSYTFQEAHAEKMRKERKTSTLSEEVVIEETKDNSDLITY